VFRQVDPVYVQILSEIRIGKISNESVQILQKYLKRQYNPEEHAGCTPTKLFSLRNKTDYVNNEMFDKIQEQVYEFHYDVEYNNQVFIDSKKQISFDLLQKCKKMEKTDVDKMVDSYINNLPFTKILSLKKGSSVMCLINLDMDVGISNGSQGIIIDFLENDEMTIPIVKFHNGIVRPMHYHYWQMEDFPTITVGQIPLALSWAMTIHKMQGTTIPMAEMDIGNSIFEYGQIYVALSRLQTLDGLYLIGFNPYRIKSNPKVVEFYEKIQASAYASAIV